jgi:hypothetical protein
MAGDARFDIPARPERHYPRAGGLEYQGGATFVLTAADDVSEAAADALARDVIEAGPYRWGDFADLPLPLYLVRDDETADTFRVSIRDGRVRLHVLPTTESAGLRGFYDRLQAATETDWSVDCHTSE